MSDELDQDFDVVEQNDDTLQRVANPRKRTDMDKVVKEATEATEGMESSSERMRRLNSEISREQAELEARISDMVRASKIPGIDEKQNVYSRDIPDDMRERLLNHDERLKKEKDPRVRAILLEEIRVIEDEIRQQELAVRAKKKNIPQDELERLMNEINSDRNLQTQTKNILAQQIYRYNPEQMREMIKLAKEDPEEFDAFIRDLRNKPMVRPEDDRSS